MVPLPYYFLLAHYISAHFQERIFDTTCQTVSEGEVVVAAGGVGEGEILDEFGGGEGEVIERGVGEVSHGISTSLEDGEVARHTLPFPPPHGMRRVSDIWSMYNN